MEKEKFQFDQQRSKLFDLLRLPVSVDELLDRAGEYDFQKQLADYTQELERFAQRHQRWFEQRQMEAYGEFNPFEPINLMASFDLKSVCEWSQLVDLLERSSEADLRSCYVRRLVQSDWLNDPNQQGEEWMIHLTDAEHWMNLIEETKMTDQLKWRYYQLLKQPKAGANRYLAWLDQIRPAFDAMWQQNQEAIEQIGHNWQLILNREGIRYFEPNYQDFISTEVLTESLGVGPVVLLCSLSSPFSLMAFEANGLSIICFGRYWQEATEQFGRFKKEKQDSRVFFFKNLGDPTRYAIFKAIWQGVQTNKELAKSLNITSATVSYHLNQLVLAGILMIDEEAGRFGYKVNQPEMIKQLAGFLEEIRQTK